MMDELEKRYRTIAERSVPEGMYKGLTMVQLQAAVEKVEKSRMTEYQKRAHFRAISEEMVLGNKR